MRLLEGLELPRERCTLRRVLAWWGGYFWLPCPCCGEPFGGYETGQRHVDHEALEGGGWTSQCCCRWCDTCAGAERSQDALARLLRVDPTELAGVAILSTEPTPPEWRCRREETDGV